MYRTILVLAVATGVPFPSQAYIEVPHSLGKCVNDSTHIVLMEVTRVNTEKNLLIFKKVADIKGKHPTDEIKHNIGKKGFHEREWKNIMSWAEVGKKAVFMYNGDASETCIGTYWYQCYREGEWWGMSHAEPFLLRTFYGDAEKLADLCTRIHKGEEVIAPCLADGSKEQLHQRKGKLQRLKASLKKQDYNAKRDFVGWGGDGDEVDEFKTTELLTASADGWKYSSAKRGGAGNEWVRENFNDASWTKGKAPIGYGEDELKNRKGTIIQEKGEDFVFRREMEIPAAIHEAKGVFFRISVASDDHAVVYLNGVEVDRDPEADHEFAYWNRDIDLTAKQVKAGKNVIAVLVRNKAGSSDLYFDLEFTAVVPVPRPPKKVNPMVVTKNAPPKDQPMVLKDEPLDPDALSIDKVKRTVSIRAAMAPRLLPTLKETYPIEVIGTYAHPRGQKAHETVVTIKGVRPQDVHKALLELGLKPGKPAIGEGQESVGPDVDLYLEWTVDGNTRRVFIHDCLVHRKTGGPIGELKWRFTGSAMKQPDPEKDDVVYGANMTGTFVSIFPVTDCCIIQSRLTMKDEPNFKLELNSKVVPKEGTAVKLVIAAR